MRSAILGGVAALLLASASQAAVLVVPSAAEGGANVGLFRISDPLHSQFQFGASLFPTTPTTFTGMSFRFDAGVSDYYIKLVQLSFDSSLKIQMANATHSVANRSATFADNLGADVTTVLSGPLQMTAAIDAPEGQTKSFDITFTFTTPFTYDPSLGDLVLDMYLPPSGSQITEDAVYGIDRVPLINDPHPFGYDNMGGLFTASDSGQGHVTSGIPVVQFITSDGPSAGHGDDVGGGPVPEPATWALMILGFGGAGVMLRRRGRLGRAVQQA